MNEENQNKKQVALFLGLASQMTVTILLFALLGLWLDKTYEIENKYFTAGFSLLGVFVSLYLIFKQLPKQ